MRYFHSISIGNVKLEGNLFLAPMAGYTDRAYRSLCLEKGAFLAYTEMVSAEGLARNNEPTKDLAVRAYNEDNLAVQLFGPDEDTMARSVDVVMRYNPQLIDINCGCPVPKVTRTGAGSALMKTPDVIGRMVRVLVKETCLPVTVKIRTGWDSRSMNYLECAAQAFDAGAAAVCMHARTKAQLYTPTAHWECLADLKKNFPDRVIIGSGDLFTARDALAMFEQTGVDAVSFARGAIGNPFVFQQTRQLLENGDFKEPSTEVKVQAMMTHLHRLSELIGENRACREMRKHVSQYLRGIPGSVKVKRITSQAVTFAEYEDSLKLLEY